MPGLKIGDIIALLRDPSIPTAGDVSGMTVEEAIEVLFSVYHGFITLMLCTMHYIVVYTRIYYDMYIDIYQCTYHGILIDIYQCIYHGIKHAICCGM